jgi:hypothetical protein
VTLELRLFTRSLLSFLGMRAPTALVPPKKRCLEVVNPLQNQTPLFFPLVDFGAGTSLVIWALFLMVTLKYLIGVLRAEDHGEGGMCYASRSCFLPQRPFLFCTGTFALLALVRRGLFERWRLDKREKQLQKVRSRQKPPANSRQPSVPPLSTAKPQSPQSTVLRSFGLVMPRLSPTEPIGREASALAPNPTSASAADSHAPAPPYPPAVREVKPDDENEEADLLFDEHEAAPDTAKRQWLLAAFVGLAVAGAAMLLGDGIITPAISVLSAVEGLNESTNNSTLVIAIACAIL